MLLQLTNQIHVSTGYGLGEHVEDLRVEGVRGILWRVSSTSARSVLSFCFLSDDRTSLTEETDGLLTYDADPKALTQMPIALNLAEARALGPLVTPKQFPCTLCGTGVCGVIVNVVQCICGAVQCPPVTTPRRID